MVATIQKLFAEPPVRLDRHRHLAWMRDLERARAALGMRAISIHVPTERWTRHWSSGEGSMTALLQELLPLAD